MTLLTMSVFECVRSVVFLGLGAQIPLPSVWLTPQGSAASSGVPQHLDLGAFAAGSDYFFALVDSMLLWHSWAEGAAYPTLFVPYVLATSWRMMPVMALAVWLVRLGSCASVAAPLTRCHSLAAAPCTRLRWPLRCGTYTATWPTARSHRPRCSDLVSLLQHTSLLTAALRRQRRR